MREFVGDASGSGRANDERLARRLKRRRVDIRGFGDYTTYLNQLGKCKELTHVVEDIDSVSEGEDTEGDDFEEKDDVDPQYKFFLERLKEDGTSYVLNLPINSYMTLSIKYEADVSSDHEGEPPSRGKSRKVPNRRGTEAVKDPRNILNKEKNCGEKNLMNVAGKDIIDSLKTAGRIMGNKRDNLKLGENFRHQPKAHVSSHAVSHQEPDPKGDHVFEAECHHEKEDNVTDATYKTFLDHIREEGYSMVLEMEGCKQVRYEEDDDADLSDAEVLVGGNVSDFKKGNYNPFESSKIRYSLMGKDKQQHLGITHTGSCSMYREKLMDKLSKPYDHNEYEKLLELINEQKPKSGRHRDLRGSASLKSYLMDEYNPSYLEQHSDLKKKIDAVKRDRRKVLNLLRGFFFWVENLAHGDAFPPWLDPSCLEALPKIPSKIKPSP
ncbi:uncharacterized protein LOC127808726 [Diospyros lotus]|uniref:uncharacterized protein LOC127808726 n=1 Tax=Diospyros lotus TaxID=55363 RepID=UPI00224D97C1|nr:uncharacterized protein LOC127808726 [Diospyros lotus]